MYFVNYPHYFSSGAFMMLGLVSLVKRSQFANLSVPKMFGATAKRLPDKIMFFFEDETWTFKQVDEISNKIANYFSSLGYVKGDSVALFMTNRPEYVAVILGLSKIGVIPALINYNLTQDSLAHSIEVSKCRGVICGAELTDGNYGEVYFSELVICQNMDRRYLGYNWSAFYDNYHFWSTICY